MASSTTSSSISSISTRRLLVDRRSYEDRAAEAAAALKRYPLPLPTADGADEEEQPPEPDPLPKAKHPATATDLDILALHNLYRANHGAAPLDWDPRLAAGAEYLTSQCPLGHSGVRGLGENMARWVLLGSLVCHVCGGGGGGGC